MLQLKVLERKTEDHIGDVDLERVPRVGEYVQVKDERYRVLTVTHGIQSSDEVCDIELQLQ
jgi:hypothetical protein